MDFRENRRHGGMQRRGQREDGQGSPKELGSVSLHTLQWFTWEGQLFHSSPVFACSTELGVGGEGER